MSSGSRWTVRLDGRAEPDPKRIGGKASSLARMRGLGLRVPPAFVITTEACGVYLETGAPPAGLWDETEEALRWLETETARRFGGAERPLLVSVRSGAVVSMPGMMDTILNLDPRGEALRPAVVAVFESSRSRRARAYRKHHGLPADLPTAVTVQAMVFGNADEHSGTGVLFTRNPLSGDPEPYGEWLARAQGEDLVAGTRTPESLARLAGSLPEAYAELVAGARRLETTVRDAQDVEFTVERGALFFLQSRVAKRSAEAALRIAVDLVNEGLLSREEALGRVTGEQARTVLRPQLPPEARQAVHVLARGEPACPGIAAGRVVDDCDEAERLAEQGQAVVLVRTTTSPEDLHGMIASQAIVTEVGGSTSHAAVVSRSLGKPCVVGCGAGVRAALAGREVTVDGERGEVLEGCLPLRAPKPEDHPYLARLIDWGLQVRELGAD